MNQSEFHIYRQINKKVCTKVVVLFDFSDAVSILFKLDKIKRAAFIANKRGDLILTNTHYMDLTKTELQG